MMIDDDYQTLSQARLRQPPDTLNQRYILEPMLAKEQLLLAYFIEVDQAHAVMLVEQGILSRADGAALLAPLRELAADKSSLHIDPSQDTLLLQIEKYLADTAGADAAGRLHTGRSRNDQGATVDRLYIRDALHDLATSVLGLQATMAERAAATTHTLMPGYTHLQHAQPTTFAHYLLRHAFTFERDQQRIAEVTTRINRNPLGLAAMAGTSWPLDQQRTAALLGLDGLVRNAMDCGTFNSDVQVEVAGVLSILVNNLARLATDLYVWSTFEFGMVDVPDGLAGTSSIMPQKKNPHSLERVMSIGGLAVGWLSSMLGATRGASSSDLGLAFATRQLPAMFDMAQGAVALLTGTLAELTLNDQLMAQRAAANWSTASNLADEIVRTSGVPFRVAHQVVGRLVGTLIAEGRDAADVRAADLRNAAMGQLGSDLPMSEEAIRQALDARHFLGTLATSGSPNPTDVVAKLDELNTLQAEHTAWLTERRHRVRAARELRRDRVQEIIATF